ncbi:alanine--tRNA ligase-related protein, partial [Erysipelothrix rhusiopathiae]|nr:alanine--tRNA ligase-related protein [Erysipelothrix rhusiopathiae]
ALTPMKYQDNVMAYRVISDHIRSLVFTLADGAVFSNEGRGYVLRRILRRAVRFGKVLEIEGTFLHGLVDDVIAVMGDSYPNLAEHRDMIVKLILSEEERFAKTLAGGEKLLLDTIEANQEAVITGDVAFKLYDTYGFPIELTQEIAEEHHVT